MGLFDTVTTTLVAVTCGECGVVFGMADHVQAQRKQDGLTFYCTNGHPRAYRDSDNKLLRDQLAKAQHTIEQTKASRDYAWKRVKEEVNEKHAVRRQLVSTKGVVTRIKNRVRKGACPCCSKTFADLRAHMDAQHPGYAGEQDAAHG